jgi:hypothetical protein
MKSEIPLLQYVRVAAPCPADWNEMKEVEGDRVKFCSGCQKRVYNLSALGQAEAEGLLRRHEGHLCVRYYRRRDGTILTTDCPVGLKAARELAFRRARASFAACLLFCTAFAAYRASQPQTFLGAYGGSAVLIGPNNEAKSVSEEEKAEGEWVAGNAYQEVMGLPVRITSDVIKVPTKPYGQVEKQNIRKRSQNKEKHE